MPDVKDTLSDVTKLGPWSNVGLELGNAEINGTALDFLISWIKQMKGRGDAAYFRVVFSRPGVTCQLEGKLDPIADGIQEEKKEGVQGVGKLELVRTKVTK